MIAAVLAAVLVAVAPTAETRSATALTPTTATLQGTVNPGGEATAYVFEYGPTTAYGSQTAAAEAGDGTEDVDVQAPLAGLAPATTYHYRVVAENASGTAQGADRTFTTRPAPRPPGIARQRARVDGPDAATLTANVDPNGTATVVAVDWGPTREYGTRTPAQPVGAGNGPVAVTVPLTGLQPRQTYHFRFVAESAAGTTLAFHRQFTTSRLLTDVSLSAFPRPVPWGGDVTLGGRVTGAGASGTPLALEATRFPYDAGWQQLATGKAGRDGGYLFRVEDQRVSTRYRVRTQTRVAALSDVAEALSRLRAGRFTRYAGRRSARVKGTIRPGIEGRVSLQRETAPGRWRFVKRKALRVLDAGRSRVGFTVRRRRGVERYRLVAQAADGRAYQRGTSPPVRVRARG